MGDMDALLTVVTTWFPLELKLLHVVTRGLAGHAASHWRESPKQKALFLSRGYYHDSGL